MIRVLSADLWPTIKRLATEADRKRAAVAYVTTDMQITFGKGDVLVADASDEAIGGGRTSAEVLAAAHARGAQLFSLPGLHAKVICLSRFAVIGSANISMLSVESLVEAAVVTDHPGVLAQARALVEQLQRQAIPIDAEFVERIAAIPVVRSPARIGRPKVTTTEHPPKTWLVGMYELDPSRFADEEEFVRAGEAEAEAKIGSESSDASWVRYTGMSKFRREAQSGDTIIQIWRSGQRSKMTHVCFPAPVVHRQDEPRCTRIFVERFVDEDERSVQWKRFVTIWRNATDEAPPPVGCARLLSAEVAERLIALWPL